MKRADLFHLVVNLGNMDEKKAGGEAVGLKREMGLIAAINVIIG